VNGDSTKDEKEKSQYQDTICSEAEDGNGDSTKDEKEKKPAPGHHFVKQRKEMVIDLEKCCTTT